MQQAAVSWGDLVTYIRGCAAGCNEAGEGDSNAFKCQTCTYAQARGSVLHQKFTLKLTIQCR
eukprot:1149718-Pelagomonas_calceolata.AAC.4